MNFLKYVAQIDDQLQWVWDEPKTSKDEVIKLESCWSDEVGSLDSTIRVISWRRPEIIEELVQHGTIEGYLPLRD